MKHRGYVCEHEEIQFVRVGYFWKPRLVAVCVECGMASDPMVTVEDARYDFSCKVRAGQDADELNRLRGMRSFLHHTVRDLKYAHQNGDTASVDRLIENLEEELKR